MNKDINTITLAVLAALAKGQDETKANKETVLAALIQALASFAMVEKASGRSIVKRFCYELNNEANLDDGGEENVTSIETEWLLRDLPIEWMNYDELEFYN
jgi:hypothetical protein